jgi:hypothetical protein
MSSESSVNVYQTTRRHIPEDTSVRTLNLIKTEFVLPKV